MTACGLWHAKRGLVAALAGSPCRIIRCANTADARFGLLEFLTARDTEIVTSQALAHGDLLPQHAARRGLVVWTVGDDFVAALLRVAAIRDPARAAALLARLPAVPLLRASLLRLAPLESQAPQRQLPLI